MKRTIHRLRRPWWQWIFALFCVGLLGSICFQTVFLRIVSYPIESERISPNFDGFTIVHLSDLHNYTFGKNQYRLLEKIDSVHPDMIAFTGDLIERRVGIDSSGIILLKQLALKYPVYFVTGNHEEALPPDSLLHLENNLQDLGIKVLNNQWDRIKRENDTLFIVGLRDAVSTRSDEYTDILIDAMKDAETEESDPEVDVSKTPTLSFVLLLAHRPEFFREYVDAGVDLVLSGHTHAGQIKFPFLGGIYAPNQGFFPEYLEGRYRERNTQMIISRGLGASVLPVRLWNPSEITVIKLKSKTVEYVKKEN